MENENTRFVFWKRIEYLSHVMQRFAGDPTGEPVVNDTYEEDDDTEEQSKEESKIEINRDEIQTITYRGKIKLHGTNTGINIVGDEVWGQGRNAFVGELHQFGFDKFVASSEKYWMNIGKKLKGERVVIFGEWCGQGINRHAASCEIPDRAFIVFAIHYRQKIMVEPSQIFAFMTENSGSTSLPPQTYIAPWCTPRFKLTLSHAPEFSEKNQKVVDYINTVVDFIDEEDPWIKQKFGVTGAGEGIVCYPLICEVSKSDSVDKKEVKAIWENGLTLSEFSLYAFKAKGSSHRGVRTRHSASLKATVNLKNVRSFVSFFLTEARFEQATTEVCGSEANLFNKDNLESISNWMIKDVSKESKLELQQVKFEWRDIEKEIKKRTKIWYTREKMKYNQMLLLAEEQDNNNNENKKKSKGSSNSQKTESEGRRSKKANKQKQSEIVLLNDFELDFSNMKL